MNYEWVSEALVSDHPLLFYQFGRLRELILVSSSYDHFFGISEFVAYESFDCTTVKFQK